MDTLWDRCVLNYRHWAFQHMTLKNQYVKRGLLENAIELWLTKVEKNLVNGCMKWAARRQLDLSNENFDKVKKSARSKLFFLLEVVWMIVQTTIHSLFSVVFSLWLIKRKTTLPSPFISPIICFCYFYSFILFCTPSSIHCLVCHHLSGKMLRYMELKYQLIYARRLYKIQSGKTKCFYK